MPGAITLEEGLLLLVIVQMIIGAMQFIRYPAIKRYAMGQTFPDKDHFVSVIVPVKGDTPTLKNHFRAVCSQAYPRYEVIFVSEREDDPGAIIAREVINEYHLSRRITKQDEKGRGEGRGAWGDDTYGSFPESITYVCSGEMVGTGMIAKSHNLIKALETASGDVYLFTDSDVFHPHTWIREMVNPLGEIVRGRTISASTAVFFIDPEGFLGIFPSLSTNAAAFLVSFTRKSQDLPSYASGASMAVLSPVFRDAGIIEAWKCNLNDDLVLASTLIDKGYHIFNVRRLPTRPIEKFEDWKGMNNKMVRWMISVNHYTHPSFHREVLRYSVSNLQFQVLLNLVLVLLVLDQADFVHPDWGFITLLLIATYGYNVLSRFIIARLIQEKNVYPYLWLSPVSQYFWGFYFMLSAFFIKRFVWGGRVYHLEKRFGRLNRLI